MHKLNILGYGNIIKQFRANHNCSEFNLVSLVLDDVSWIVVIHSTESAALQAEQSVPVCRNVAGREKPPSLCAYVAK